MVTAAAALVRLTRLAAGIGRQTCECGWAIQGKEKIDSHDSDNAIVNCF